MGCPYREGQGGLVYPSLGSITAKEIGNPAFPLPNFVAVGRPGYSSGFIGARYQPLNVQDANRGVENLKALVSTSQFDKRFGLLEEMEQGFFKAYKAEAGGDHRTTYERAVRLMKILEEYRVVGPSEGTKPRKILVGTGDVETLATILAPRQSELM